jgi:hypothetical protein
MLSKKDAPQRELSADQIAELKQAIADLAEAKRVSPEMLSASQFINAELQQTGVGNPPPLSQHFLWRYRWPLASGIIGIVIGFTVAIL